MKTFKLLFALLLVTCLFSMCKKGSKTDGVSNSVYYFKGTLGGKAVNWQVLDSPTGWLVGSGSTLPNDEGNISGGITAQISYYPGLVPMLGIEFKTILKHVDDDATTVFNKFVNTGPWPYAADFNYKIGTKSVLIYYTDSNGKEYSSIGAQNGSSLNVISSTPVTGDNYNIDPGLRIKLIFNCTLYPSDGVGNPLTITNGEAVVFLDNMLLL